MVYKITYKTTYAGTSNYSEPKIVYLEAGSFNLAVNHLKTKVEEKYEYTTVYFISVEQLPGSIWKD